ncbi:CYFA0S02e05160g1_1 [Cyberlindnera fabianii]|uniref:CYFA0S02e05160g1_1 n=2 Tax=Cyberlindnera fabianii TaxID=36022 RepID=A0A061AMF8_CYBFA|nr:CYFA0S02e05160g1_1 [Cyberlindnera fabianii]
MATDKKIAVAFVCLGNICRSPMAEAVFTHIVNTKGLSDRFERIDSFGTSGYHIGETPDSRSASTCRKHNVPVNHRAQRLTEKHFDEFDFLIGMDESNIFNMERIKPKKCRAQVKMFGEYNTGNKFKSIVDDPYYGGTSGFEYNFDQVTYFSEEFLKKELGM